MAHGASSRIPAPQQRHTHGAALSLWLPETQETHEQRRAALSPPTPRDPERHTSDVDEVATAARGLKQVCFVTETHEENQARKCLEAFNHGPQNTRGKGNTHGQPRPLLRGERPSWPEPVCGRGHGGGLSTASIERGESGETPTYSDTRECRSRAYPCPLSTPRTTRHPHRCSECPDSDPRDAQASMSFPDKAGTRPRLLQTVWLGRGAASRWEAGLGCLHTRLYLNARRGRTRHPC